MKVKKPFLIFIVGTLLLTIIFFLFPINMFDGVIEIKEPHRSYSLERPLSLSYFIGIGYDKSDMEFVEDFYLTPKGISMAFIFLLGFPALFAYRIHLRDKFRKQKGDT